MFKATEIGAKKGKFERYILKQEHPTYFWCLKFYLQKFLGSGIARKSISLPHRMDGKLLYRFTSITNLQFLLQAC
jgi:hypothetical protein